MAERIDPSQLSSAHRTPNTPRAAVDADTGPRKSPEPGKRIVSGSGNEGPYRPSISLDPRNLKSVPHFDEFEMQLRPAVQALSVTYEGLNAISNARVQADRNPCWNEYQKLLQLSGAAEKKWDEMNKAFDSALKALTNAADALDNSLSAPLEHQASVGSLNAEIRAHVRNLSSEERMGFINDAFKKGKTKVLASILGTEPFLSGISDELHVVLTRRYNEQQNPEALRRLDATRATIKLLEARGALVFNEVQKAMGGTWEKVQKLRKANSEAEKALIMQSNDVTA